MQTIGYAVRLVQPVGSYIALYMALHGRPGETSTCNSYFSVLCTSSSSKPRVFGTRTKLYNVTCTYIFAGWYLQWTLSVYVREEPCNNIVSFLGRRFNIFGKMKPSFQWIVASTLLHSVRWRERSCNNRKAYLGQLGVWVQSFLRRFRLQRRAGGGHGHVMRSLLKEWSAPLSQVSTCPTTIKRQSIRWPMSFCLHYSTAAGSSHVYTTDPLLLQKQNKTAIIIGYLQWATSGIFKKERRSWFLEEVFGIFFKKKKIARTQKN